MVWRFTNDWCLTIAEDLRYIDIQLSEAEIKSMTKFKLKKLVMKKVTELSRQYLITLKQKHSKSAGLSAEYKKMQQYLCSDKLTTEEMQLLRLFPARPTTENRMKMTCRVPSAMRKTTLSIFCTAVG